MTKYVAMQRPQRRLSFWKRTLTVFLLALVAVFIVLVFLYNRSFSLANQSETIPGIGSVNSLPIDQSVSNQAQPVPPAVTEQPTPITTDPDAGQQEGGAWLFDAGAAEESAPAANGATVNLPSTTTIVNNGQQDQLPAMQPAPNTQPLQAASERAFAELEEQPELVRDLRLSEQALDEDEPRVATELLLTLAQTYPAFRPTQVAERLYLAYLALGDQAMRREARSEAIGYYDQAGQLAVVDQTALLHRREAIARLFPSLLTPSQAQTIPVTVAPQPIVPVVPPVATVAPIVSAPTATPAPPAPVLIEVAPTCPDDHVALTAPTINARVDGSVAVVGSVRLEDLWFYKLEWAAADSAEFAYFGGTSRTVQNGLLGRLDTTTLPNGEYVIRVTVVDQTGNYPPPCEVQVVVEN